MNNNKGFTLTEVLLAVMIVGLVGVALAALTGTAVRESNLGRTRMTLRNQASIALRQLRQDVHQSSSVICNGNAWTLTQEKQIEPDSALVNVTYTFDGAKITRNGEDWLGQVRKAKCDFVYGGAGFNSILKIRLVLGVDSEPPVMEVIEETFMLPHGVSIKG